MKRLLVPSSALLWGLQMAFLSPALALILVSLYGATTAQVGWVLSIDNVSGFVASLLIPAYADRLHDYLRPMLVCGALTVVFAVVLAFATTLPAATVAFFRAVMPALAGTTDMRYRTFVVYNALGGVLWGTAVVMGGYLAGASYSAVESWLGRGAAVLVGVLAVAAAVVWLVRRRRAERAPDEVEGVDAGPTDVAAPVDGPVAGHATCTN